MSKSQNNELLVELFQPILRRCSWTEVIAAVVEAAARNKREDKEQAEVDAESSLASAYCQASRSERQLENHIAEMISQPIWSIVPDQELMEFLEQKGGKEKAQQDRQHTPYQQNMTDHHAETGRTNWPEEPYHDFAKSGI